MQRISTAMSGKQKCEKNSQENCQEIQVQISQENQHEITLKVSKWIWKLPCSFLSTMSNRNVEWICNLVCRRRWGLEAGLANKFKSIFSKSLDTNYEIIIQALQKQLSAK